MEQRDILSPRPGSLTAEQVAERLAAAGAPARRTSPQNPAGAGPSERPRGDHDLNPDFYKPGSPLVPAAVLVPIVTHAEELSLLLTRRTEHLNDHAGQVSFPGGRVDPADQDAWAAALRETEEEVGLPRKRVRLAGALDTYVTRTGFEVTPLVGLVAPPFTVTPDSFEVAEVFEVPLAFFLEPGNCEIHSRVYEGKERYFFAFPYRSHYIWGATAGMLVNLAEVLSTPC
jgi:8-oxo-dGTP pyrophosphatase MutT (NUDIX family)